MFFSLSRDTLVVTPSNTICMGTPSPAATSASGAAGLAAPAEVNSSNLIWSSVNPKASKASLHPKIIDSGPQRYAASTAVPLQNSFIRSAQRAWSNRPDNNVASTGSRVRR